MQQSPSEAPPEIDAVPADASQRAVLDLAVDGSAVVLGGPGTGKTWTLVELVAHRVLIDGVDPADVLVLAPNRAAATALRDVLAVRLGVALPGPLARTAASVASEIVRAEATRRGDEVPRLLTGAEQDRVLAELIEGHIDDDAGPAWPAALTPEIRRLSPFRTELRELLGRMHEGNITTHGLRALAAEIDRPEWVAAADFFDSYYSVIDSYRGASLDSAEMIAHAVAAIRAGSAVRMPAIVLVDDAQELTLGTVEMLAAWAQAGAAVVAFGDPDVAVTGFRGGRADLLTSLGRRLGVAAPVLTLAEAHRVGGAVAPLVHEITSRIGSSGATAHRRPVIGEAAGDTALLRVDAPTRAEEAGRIARRLRELHVLEGVPWDSMAVVLRSGRLVPSFARMLSLAGVPTRTSVAARALREEWAPRHLVLAVQNAIDAESSGDQVAETLKELLLGPVGGIDVLALRRLRLALRHEEVSGGGSRSADELMVEAMSSPGRFATIDMAAARRADRLATTLGMVREQHAAGASIEELLWAVWERSGLAAVWAKQAEGSGVLADEANHHLDSVVSLFAAARRFVERSPELAPGAFIAEFLAADLPEDTLAVRARTGAVFVCPPASVVGAEFEVVCVAAVQDGVWPNLRLRSSLLHADQLAPASEGVSLAVLDDRKQVLHDELRMFALAVSRARSLVILSTVSSSDEQPSPLVRLLPPDVPVADDAEPLTLRGLVGRLRRELAVDPASDAASALARLAADGVAGADPAQWYGMSPLSTDAPLVDLSDPDARVPVSPSRLSTIEKSPLGWFVDAMGASPSGFHADLGTLVHAAMETLSTTPDAELHADAVMALIDARWHEFRFDSPWEGEYQRARARTRAEGLADYLTGFARDGHVLAGAETAFSFELGQAVVTGKIDRVEHLNDGTLVIVDLKTGSTVPRADELATHAQLGLYQLAAAHDGIEGLPEGATRGGAKLLFVASGVRGRLFRESRQEPLTPDELEGFRERVRAAAETMAGTMFPGVDGLDDRDPLGAYPYRIHLIPAVSA
ncbi:UrvD/REP family ATP-dependent DNA helicase [Herbiconiux sp. L3-i23]|uniref:UrvD/REP family ATP-dependent DNA helicase n=1 Tax=Herbiconiux sp. L3-i23 TaxID=2905871 RepID=UPI002073F61B|nr:UrvD/REP family ATP-dependent DNA helicase [Herbiconiux sp. L3-i23]